MDGRALRLRPWLALLAVLIVAAGLVSVRWLRDAPPTALPSALADRDASPLDLAIGSEAERVAPPHDAERAKLEELQAMSETFRNTTFLIAIRDSGFRCNELLSVYGGLNNSHTWTATCSEMLSYTVRVATLGTLVVEPTLQYFDGLGPATR
jgi:hypothetical protein